MTEELRVVLRRSELTGFGFSLLGTTGPPHVIYDIIENSPAADCGAVEAGDVILKVNGTDVHRYTTKEVLKCLRLSDDLVTLELKRDPKLKARIKEQLAKTKSPHYVDIEPHNIYDCKSGQISPTHSQTDSLNSSSSLRYRSPTNLPPRQTSANHSRSSSASSAKIQIVEGTSGGTTAVITASTSPSTCRPSRIPTALKNPQKNIVQHSPQHKRPRPSQIPTKASVALAAAAGAANGNTTNTISTQLQHSRSCSGGGGDGGGDGSSSSKSQHQREYQHHYNRQEQHQQLEDDRESLSAPPQPKRAPRFEAFMMTGDLILNLSRTPQSSNLIVEHAKKVDSLRDSPNRSAARANGALAPRASGESSPTSSLSVESPTHSGSSDSVNLLKKNKDKNYNRNQKPQQKQQQQHQQQQQQQQHQHSINNTFSNNSSDRQCRKDSLTNDTLLLCEELDRDDEEEQEEEEGIEEQAEDFDNDDYERTNSSHFVKLSSRDSRQKQQERYRRQQKKQQRQQQGQQQQRPYESYEENEEDQTHYDIANIETYNSVGGAGTYVGVTASGADSEHQFLVMHDEDDDYDDFNYEQHQEDEDLSACISISSNSLASASAKQKLRDLKHKQKQQQQLKQHHNSQSAVGDDAAAAAAAAPTRTSRTADSVSSFSAVNTIDLVDYARGAQRSSIQQQQHFYQHYQHSSSSSSGGTIKSEGTSQDETSFSAPNSPISLSTPLLDKETANSVPTSPEPSNLTCGGAVGGINNTATGAGTAPDSVVRRQNGVVRKCDSAGFRTSKSEDHLQQIQREGIAAVIPIDIDEDVNSSLNTLLDTRHDSEDSQPTHIKTAASKPSVLLRHRNILNKRRKNVRILIPRIVLGQQILTTTKTMHNNNSYNRTTTTINSTATSATTFKKASNRDRIVWTYNAPLTPQQLYQQQQQQQQNAYYGRSSPNSHSSSLSSSSPHHSDSPASPTSVSSSVMSSSGSKGALGLAYAGGAAANAAAGASAAANSAYQQQQQQHQQLAQANAMGLLQCPVNGGGSGGGGVVPYGDHSVSEAISNISSPDYQDDDNLFSSRDLVGGMVLSEPSDSDSTIMVSDAVHGRTKKSASSHQQQQQQQQQQLQQNQLQQKQHEHKLVIQVRGFDSSSSNSPRSAFSELKDSEAELATLIEEPPNSVTETTTSLMTAFGAITGTTAAGGNSGDCARDASPPVSDDGSDVESLHSYHYSPKAVDMPSAIRLAKRLYSLDGFKKSDVSRHLSKNNDFSRAVADEYLKYFSFEKKTLDQSLREFLQQFALSGETQERERVLVHFSKRFLDCNPGSFNSQDAVHTLTCAIMLLNTDLHGQNIGRKMTCAEFVDNLAELNDGENFPKDVLKYLYQAIKSQPLEWALDDEIANMQKQLPDMGLASIHIGQNPFLDIPESSAAVEYKKGYVMRKCCYEANYKKTPFGKRSWKMFYCTLRDLVLFLHKDEHGFRKSQMSDNLHNAIRLHHALATKATDYTKKQHVFRLQTADRAEYLFQTSDSKELQSWVETINFVCAAYSAPPLEGGVGSQKRFQRPLLPSTHTKMLLKEQLDSHERQVVQLETNLIEHKKGPIPNKGLPLQNFKEKESYLQYELHRYKSYVAILNAKLLADQQMDLQLIKDEDSTDTFAIVGSGGVGSLAAVANAAQRNAHVIAAAATAANQMQSNSITASGQQQQPQQHSAANRRKEKKK